MGEAATSEQLAEKARASALIEAIAGRHAERSSRADRPSVLVGLVGRGIGASRSPLMHNREGERLGLHYDYALIDFDRHGLRDHDLDEVVSAAQDSGFAGLNVTHPFKQRIVDVLSRLSPEAAAIGAVNTVVFTGAVRVGHNTDSWGFATSFRRDMAQAQVGEVALIGAGGGGAAVAHALLELGVGAIRVVDPDGERAAALADRLGNGRITSAATASDAIAGASGIINATPIGMAKYPGTPFETRLLSSRPWVADIVYVPEETALLREARNLGCHTLTGRGMAVFQAVRAFELFTGIAPDRDAMDRHFDARGAAGGALMAAEN